MYPENYLVDVPNFEARTGISSVISISPARVALVSCS